MDEADFLDQFSEFHLGDKTVLQKGVTDCSDPNLEFILHSWRKERVAAGLIDLIIVLFLFDIYVYETIILVE